MPCRALTPLAPTVPLHSCWQGEGAVHTSTQAQTQGQACLPPKHEGKQADSAAHPPAREPTAANSVKLLGFAELLAIYNRAASAPHA